jgi:hypothetical protein
LVNIAAIVQVDELEINDAAIDEQGRNGEEQRNGWDEQKLRSRQRAHRQV